MRTAHRVMAAAIFLLPAGVPASAQQAPAARNYDPATVESVVGTVVRLETVRAPGGAQRAIHAHLRTATGTVTVHLGPYWYLDTQTLALKAGDQVTVRGSRVAVGGEPAIIAATVRRGGDVLVLRDSTGVPLWSAGPGGDPRRP